MKNVIFALAAVACFAAPSAMAAQVAIGFQVHSGPIPLEGMTGLDREAADQIETRYGAEKGFTAVVGGRTEGVTVLVTKWRYARRIWSKMLRNGDAIQQGAQGYYLVKDTVPVDPEPQVRWLPFGSLYMDEGATGFFRSPLRPEFVTLYKVTAHKSCSVSNSGVHKANYDDRIRSTRLVSTKRVGNNIHYTYEVNGGDGVRVSGISVTLAPPRFALIFNNCQVNVYIADE